MRKSMAGIFLGLAGLTGCVDDRGASAIPDPRMEEVARRFLQNVRDGNMQKAVDESSQEFRRKKGTQFLDSLVQKCPQLGQYASVQFYGYGHSQQFEEGQYRSASTISGSAEGPNGLLHFSVVLIWEQGKLVVGDLLIPTIPRRHDGGVEINPLQGR